MDQWTARLKNHTVWETLTAVGRAIDVAVKREGIAPTDAEGVERLRTVIQFVGKRLSAADPHLVDFGSLDVVAAQLVEVGNSLRSFIESGDSGGVVNANSYADGGLSHMKAILTPQTSQEIEGLHEVLEMFRGTMQQAVRNQSERVAEVSGAVETLASRATEIEGQLAGERQNLVRLVTELQGQFSTAQADRQVAFQALRDEIRDDLTEQLGEFKEARERHTAAQEVSIAEIHRDFVGKADGVLAIVEERRTEVEKIVEAVAQRGVATDFLKAAAGAKSAKILWQGLTVAAFAILILTGHSVFLSEAGPDSITWPGLMARIVLMATVGLLAGFTAKQADKNQGLEKLHHQRGMEMATLEPFLSRMRPEDQNELRKKIGSEVFGREIGSGDDGKPAATSVVALILDNPEFQKTLQEAIKTAGGKWKK